MKVRNTQPGPRGLNTASGPILVDPGQEVEIDLNFRKEGKLDTERRAAELANLRATGWFDIDGAPSNDNDDEAAEREALKKEASELNIEFARNLSTAKLKELVEVERARRDGGGAP